MVKSILVITPGTVAAAEALDARVNNFLAAVSKQWGGLNYFRALSMRHFFGGTSRSLVTLELRTFIASEAPASICAGLALELLNLADISAPPIRAEFPSH